MSRVPFMTRDTMTPEGQEIWDEIETSRGGVARNYAAPAEQRQGCIQPGCPGRLRPV